MALGMSRAEYWYGPITNIFDYVEADAIRQERFNQEAWLQGMYVADATFTAITNAFAKNENQKVEYPREPYKFEQPDENEVEDNDSTFALAYMEQMMKAGESWGNH